MAKVNTEQPAGKNAKGKEKAGTPKKNKEEINASAPVKKEEIKTEEKKSDEGKKEEKNKTETKKPEVKKTKKTKVSVNVKNLKVSTKTSIAICKFIMKKKIDEAIKNLEEVVKLRKAVPMKGEYAHRKGKIMSGKYPVESAKKFIILLKSLKGNANNHSLEEPVITEAVSNKGSMVYASGGRTKKRTHIIITASEKKLGKTSGCEK